MFLRFWKKAEVWKNQMGRKYVQASKQHRGKMLSILPKHPHVDLSQWKIFFWSSSQVSWDCIKVFRSTYGCHCRNFKYPVEILKLLRSKSVWCGCTSSPAVNTLPHHQATPWAWGSAYSWFSNPLRYSKQVTLCWAVLGSAEVAHDAYHDKHHLGSTLKYYYSPHGISTLKKNKAHQEEA